jgi:DNA repair exonuclease SbcCD ATPase subunit
MTMHDPHSEQRAGGDVILWLQDQVGQLRAHLGRTQQQGDQVQAAILDVNEKLRDAEGRLRELGARTVGLPTMQEQMRQVSGLLERIQDAEVLIDTKFEQLERTQGDEHTREQAERNDAYRRLQELERRAESLGERQASVDDTTRRFAEEVSRSHVQLQGLGQRMEAVESKTGRNLDAMTRIEQAHSEIESAVRALRREDDVLAERARLAHEVAARLETEMHTQAEEYRAIPLLAERVELLRAERQRLEDRTSRVEESLEDARTRLERQEDVAGQTEARLKAHDARIDHVHSSTLDYRRSLTDQLLKLNVMLERMKRRQVEELERQVKELRVQSNQLKSEDE